MVSDQDALVVWSSANDLDEEEIAKTCERQVLENTASILKATNPKDVSKEVLLKVVSADGLNVQEVDLFRFVHAWSECHQESIEVVKEMVSHIRLSQISMKDLVNVVKPTKLVTLESYVEAFEFQTEPDSVDNSKKRFKPRDAVKRTESTGPMISLRNYGGSGVLAWITKSGGFPSSPIAIVPGSTSSGTYVITETGLCKYGVSYDQISPILGLGNFAGTVCSPGGIMYLTLDLHIYKLVITHCTLKCNFQPEIYLQSFNLLGSNNGHTWDKLACISNNRSNPVTFSTEKNNGYRYFQLMNTSRQVLCSGWEMYGDLYKSK